MWNPFNLCCFSFDVHVHVYDIYMLLNIVPIETENLVYCTKLKSSHIRGVSSVDSGTTVHGVLYPETLKDSSILSI